MAALFQWAHLAGLVLVLAHRVHSWVRLLMTSPGIAFLASSGAIKVSRYQGGGQLYGVFSNKVLTIKFWSVTKSN